MKKFVFLLLGICLVFYACKPQEKRLENVIVEATSRDIDYEIPQDLSY
jgi:hypothetical protein